MIKANLGYRARPHDGVWATPPFLHNGSVPNLYQMLVPAASRSTRFYLGSTRFDPKHVGYETFGFQGAFEMDTSLPGNSNAGHEFRNLTLEELEEYDPGTALKSRRALGRRALRSSLEKLNVMSSEERWANWRAVSEKYPRRREESTRQGRARPRIHRRATLAACGVSEDTLIETGPSSLAAGQTYREARLPSMLSAGAVAMTKADQLAIHHRRCGCVLPGAHVARPLAAFPDCRVSPRSGPG